MLEPRDDTPDVPDYELVKATEDRTELPPRRQVGLWIVAAALIAAIGIAAFVVFGGRRHTSAPASTERASAAAPVNPVQPLGGDAEPIVVPPLDESDPLVRELVKKLSSNPRIAAWLATDGLVRNFTVVISNIGEGRTPAAHLRVLRPPSSFQVIDRQGVLYVDPGSYKRYDSLAAATASVDPAGAARLYATLKPRIQEAYRELGVPDGAFDRALERAIVLLLQTPVVDEPVRVEPHGGTGYGFADPELEALTGAQKQLLRTGPANVRTIQASLRAIALALGIPAERLPVPHSRDE